MQISIVELVITIATVLITSLLTYYFSNKARRNITSVSFKENKYALLLNLLDSFVGNTANGESKREFFKELHESWLYSSDEVILAVNDMVSLVRNSKGKRINQEQGKLAVGSIVLAMRKDLHVKTKLDALAFEFIDVIDSPK